jgi:hypothetical protein
MEHMAQIKSALELALERTKDIKGDREGLEAKEYREIGMKLVSRAENEPATDLKAELAKYKDKQLAWVREGMKQVLLSHINLPAGKDQLGRFEAVRGVFMAASRNAQAMEGYLQELGQFFEQYLAQREQLIQAVQKQLEPSLRQKEEALAKQTGRRVRLTVESDPEFAKYLNNNLDKLVAQYIQALDQIKAEVLELLA